MAIAAIGSLGMVSLLPGLAQAATYTLDFDSDANGNAIDVSDLGLSVGDWETTGNQEDYIVSDQWLADFGVSISAFSKPKYNKNTGEYDLSRLGNPNKDLVLFNTDPNYYSSNSSARKSNDDFKSSFDEDLLTGFDSLTGKTYLAANGDRSNTPINLGNVLIIQENNRYYNPDDNANGGLISFGFEDLVNLSSIDLLDVSDDFGRRGQQIVFAAYGENDEKINTWMFDEEALANGTAEQLSQGTDDNSLYRFNFDTAGIKRLDVLYPGSGAIAALRWEQNQNPPTIPEPASIVGLLAIAGLGFRFKRTQTT